MDQLNKNINRSIQNKSVKASVSTSFMFLLYTRLSHCQLWTTFEGQT